MDLSAALVGAGALCFFVLCPGLALVLRFDLSRDALVRFVASVAIGRLLFAATTLVATEVGGGPMLPALAGCAGLAFCIPRILRERAQRVPSPGSGTPPVAIALAVASGLALVFVFVGRSALAAASGDLVFYGRDSTNDPLVYASMALQLAENGLPLSLPFAGGGPGPAPYGTYAVLAGLALVSPGAILEYAFRVVPAFDAVTMTLSAVALTRALGGGTIAMAMAGPLLALGTEASFLVAPVAGLLGRAVQPLDTWALFGPYLAAFNPIAAALQTWLAACTLLASAGVLRPAVVLTAGVLTGLLFELKLFLWAPAMAGLVGTALLRPPAALARPLRLAALAAVAASLPSVIDRIVWAQRLAGRDDTAFSLCPGCLPRYVAEASWGNHDLSFALFRSFRASQLTDPGVLGATFVATLGVGAIVLGARLFAVPVLLGAARGDDGPAVALRAIGLAALAGLGASILLVTTPHYLNGAQFAWAATFGLWPPTAIALERSVRERRLVAVALVLVLAFAGTSALVVRLGLRAPIWQRVPAAERSLLQTLGPISAPRDVVLEPSMIGDPDRASPVPWITGRSVYLSLLSAVQSVPDSERERRFDVLLAVFQGSDREAAARAIAESGAEWVYAPAAFRLRFDANGLLEPVGRSDAGTLYRVLPGAEAGGTQAP